MKIDKINRRFTQFGAFQIRRLKELRVSGIQQIDGIWTALPQSIKDGEYGLRVSWYTHALDFSLAAFYGWNDIPFTEKNLSFLLQTLWFPRLK